MDTITISLRVTAPGPAAARVSVGRRQFSIGRPLEFDEASPHVAAIEYALGAVGGEVVNGLRAFARAAAAADRRRRGLVTGELENGLAYLEVVGEQRAAEDRAHPREGVRRVADDAAGHACVVRTDARAAAARVHAARGRSALTIELILTS